MMKCESVIGNRRPDVHGHDDDTGLWHAPPGTWRWRLGGSQEPRVLEAVLPSKYPENSLGVIYPHQMCHCPVVIGPHPNNVTWGWDGNVESPTLTPSILVSVMWGEERQRVFWHGYLKAGVFSACE